MKYERGKWFKGFRFVFSLLAAILFAGMFFPLRPYAGTIYSSPYVSFSPDKQAFTTNAGDRGIQWYGEDLIIRFRTTSMRELRTGEHYYRAQRTRAIPVGYWQVEHKEGACIHNSYPPAGVSYHGISFGRKTCGSRYYSGWLAYCADCGGRITNSLLYMSKEAASSISELDLKEDYYYLCPFCRNLEMGASPGVHLCKEISWNRYQVQYDKNTGDWVDGYMGNTFHMYQNAQLFEGKEIAAEKKLRKNTYKRAGYIFTGWNTRPDGKGQSFQDEQEIFNLTAENYDQNGRGVVRLYAQWLKMENTLRIDPAGGLYQGKREITSVGVRYGDDYKLEMNDLKEPDGNIVSFETYGGTEIRPITGKTEFLEWEKQSPFQGVLHDNTYYCTVMGGAVDTIKAVYRKKTILLPYTEKAGYSLQGWYRDPECSVWIGKAGDPFLPESDVTLYAAWKADLALAADIERILEPSDPVFRCGESGKLRFRVSGYAERVEIEFPEEFSETMSDTDVCVEYDGKELSQEGEVIFMVPLYIQKGEYVVGVKAFRGDEMLSEMPVLWVLGEEESVLNDLRTRLR